MTILQLLKLTGPKLKTWRLTRSLTLPDVERIFGVDRVTWWRAECNGPRFPLLWAMALAGYDHINQRKDN